MKNGNKENNEEAFLSFLLKKKFYYTVIGIIIFLLLLPFLKQVLGRMRLSSLYNKMQKISAKQLDYEISNNVFSKDFQNLDVKLKDNSGNYLSGDSARIDNFYLRMAKNGLLGINRKENYFVYYAYKNATLYCAPKDSYICKNIAAMPEDICKEADMYWSNLTNSCFIKEKDMCLALGMPWDSKGENIFCGYRNLPNLKIYESGTCIGTTPSGCQNSIVYDNATCEGLAPFACMGSKLNGGNCLAKNETACHSVQINNNSSCIVSDDYNGNYGCQNAQINKGGTCFASGNNLLACNKPIINNGGTCRGYALQSCNEATVLPGGICEGNIPSACQSITVKEGGRCISNVPQTCNGTYEEGSCCHGDFCPDYSPKCNCPAFATNC